MTSASPEMAPEGHEAGGGREIEISGKAVNDALWLLREVDANYPLEGLDQKRLDDDIGQAERDRDEKRANVLGGIRELTRPNSRIIGVRATNGDSIIKLEVPEIDQNPH